MPVIPLNIIPGTIPTAGDLLEQTRSYLLSNHRDQVNRLSAAVLAGATTLTFEVTPIGVDVGTYLSVGLETFQVFSVNQQAKSASVLGGVRGSPLEAHAVGDTVFVDPEFSNHAIFRELNMELRALSAPSGIFQVKTVDLTYNSSRVGFDLTGVTGLIDILSVQCEQPDTDRSWPSLRPREYRLDRNADPTDFPSGIALMIHGGSPSPGRSVRVEYAKEFTLLESLADSVILRTGLPDTAIDIPALGAASRLVGVQESKRTLSGSQRDPRRSDEIPPGAITGASRLLGAMKMERLANERARLLKRYPIRVR